MRPMTDGGSMSQTEQLVFTIILLLATLFCGMDLVADYQEGTSWWHLAMEAGFLLSGITGVALLLRLWWATRGNLNQALRNLTETRADLNFFQAQARRSLEGLGNAIEAQFEQWSLSAAEKEVGLLILKGLSFKDIAAVRCTSERTVRQQAGSIYGKADLAGRAEFAAFFLEDLLLPGQVKQA